MNKIIIRLISTLVPSLLAQYVYKKITCPQPSKFRQHELDVLNKSQKSNMNFGNFKIQLYHWEGKGQNILLVHGWEGHAGNFANLIEKLIQKDYNVYAFDAPSHGLSSVGKTNLFESADLVTVLLEKFCIESVISHSFGSVVMTMALYKNTHRHIQKCVLFTTPDQFMERVNSISSQVGITPKVKQHLIQKLNAELANQKAPFDIYGLNVSHVVREIYVPNALIIHDKNDRIIPIEQAQRVQKNWNDCLLYEVEGTGHFRILRTDFVLQKAISFLDT